MKQHVRLAAVPAALIAFSAYGAAAPAMAQPAHPHHGRADAHPSNGQTVSGRAAPKTADGADTFAKPNDWQAQADPDGMDNDGVDQPGGTGGTIGAQDGNNGSGNDADCEDDNRGKGIPGHCKDKRAQARPAAETPAVVPPAAAVKTQAPGTVLRPVSPNTPVAQPVALPAQVLGTSVVRPRTQPHLSAPGTVAGISASVQPAGGLLPNTGAGDLAPLGAAGVALVGGGAGLLLWTRRRLAA